MFVELMPLLGERTVMITVARLNQNSIRVNLIPSRQKEDEDAALAIPLSFSGTPEELDAEIAKSLVPYVKAEMEAATKAAREQAKTKTTPGVKKQEQTAALEAPSPTTVSAEQNMTLFATQQK